MFKRLFKRFSHSVKQVSGTNRQTVACGDCLFRNRPYNAVTEFDLCNAPQNVVGIDRVTGSPIRRFTYCSVLRNGPAGSTFCGAEALWYQPITLDRRKGANRRRSDREGEE